MHNESGIKEKVEEVLVAIFRFTENNKNEEGKGSKDDEIGECEGKV